MRASHWCFAFSSLPTLDICHTLLQALAPGAAPTRSSSTLQREPPRARQLQSHQPVRCRCIGDQVGTKRRAPVVVGYVPYAFVEGPQGVRIPKFASQPQQTQQHEQMCAAERNGSDDEAAPANPATREDWLVVLAKAAPEKKEWVRRPGT
jgi:hypothetical protein